MKALLVRLRADGSPDSAFGADGVVVTPYEPAGNVATHVLVQADGKLVVSLARYDSDGWAVARYLPDGTLETN